MLSTSLMAQVGGITGGEDQLLANCYKNSFKHYVQSEILAVEVL